ncbi:hypothetical protein OJJOAM_002003 [Cupriavidus sp. H18C1]|uniref:hypothetical protein n=1 Tax=Cupriavidus sp. H18C1 TaxID=3241601 RepID=UPI003BB8B10A
MKAMMTAMSAMRATTGAATGAATGAMKATKAMAPIDIPCPERPRRRHGGPPLAAETVDANPPQRQGMLMPWRKGIYRHPAVRTAIVAGTAGTADTGPARALAPNRTSLQTRPRAVDDSAVHLYCRAAPRKP